MTFAQHVHILSLLKKWGGLTPPSNSSISEEDRELFLRIQEEQKRYVQHHKMRILQRWRFRFLAFPPFLRFVTARMMEERKMRILKTYPMVYRYCSKVDFSSFLSTLSEVRDEEMGQMRFLGILHAQVLVILCSFFGFYYFFF